MEKPERRQSASVGSSNLKDGFKVEVEARAEAKSQEQRRRRKAAGKSAVR